MQSALHDRTGVIKSVVRAERLIIIPSWSKAFDTLAYTQTHTYTRAYAYYHDIYVIFSWLITTETVRRGWFTRCWPPRRSFCSARNCFLTGSLATTGRWRAWRFWTETWRRLKMIVKPAVARGRRISRSTCTAGRSSGSTPSGSSCSTWAPCTACTCSWHLRWYSLCCGVSIRTDN